MLIEKSECFPLPGQPVLPECKDAALNPEAARLSQQVKERLQKLTGLETGGSERVATTLLAIPQEVLMITAWRLSSPRQDFPYWEKNCMERFSAIGAVMLLDLRNDVNGIDSTIRRDGKDLCGDARVIFELCSAAGLNPVVGWTHIAPCGAYNGFNALHEPMMYIRWNLPGETRTTQIRRWLSTLFA